jgi:methionyl-tRNA formyltransferase
MLMDVGLDTGPMLLKKEIPITRTDSGGSLHDRLAAIGASAVLEALDGYSRGTLTPVPQPTEGVTYAAKIEKVEAIIDWRRDSFEIERQVRAFNPWPVAETRLEGEQLRIFEAMAEDTMAEDTGKDCRDNAKIGTIVAVRDDAVVVQCGAGRLALRQVQRPGRRTVSAGDFARGGAGASGLIGQHLG